MKAKWYVTGLKYLVTFLVFLFIIFPIYWIVSCSFRPESDFMTMNPSLIGNAFTLRNYETVFTTAKFGRNIINSLIYTLGTVALTIVLSSLAAYAISFFPKFKLSRHITSFLLLSQMLPGLVTTIVLFFVYWKIGILNTYLSMILTYSCGGLALPIIMLCGYYEEIPKDLLDSAYIDGANAFKAFYKILLPLAAPGLLCTAIYIFIVTWQEFPSAQNLITDSSMYNVTVGLSVFNEEHGKDWGGLMAASTLIMVPTLIMFVSIQNYFIDNLAGSIKE